jgi:hypothetical protein
VKKRAKILKWIGDNGYVSNNPIFCVDKKTVFIEQLLEEFWDFANNDSRPIDAPVMQILVETRDILSLLTRDLREWLQYAKYLRTEQEYKITEPNRAGIERSESILDKAYNLNGKIRAITDELELPDEGLPE